MSAQTSSGEKPIAPDHRDIIAALRAAIVIGIIALNAVAVNQLMVPDGWMTPFFDMYLELDWSTLISEVNDKIASDGYSLFGIFFMMMIFKGVLVSLAGPAPNYDMQKILFTKSPREAALMSGSVSLILMPVRYFMIAGFGVLPIIYYERLDLLVGGVIDFEQILPSAINEFVPAGLLGLLLAGLLSAFVSTFAGTLNAIQAYIVNHIYLKHINPRADNRKIKWMNYLAGLTIVTISIILGFCARDFNDRLCEDQPVIQNRAVSERINSDLDSICYPRNAVRLRC